MPIVASDIKLYLSGGAANTDPNASLGGARSNTELVSGTIHNLFDKVTSGEAAAGTTEYRCIYVRNEHATLTWEDVAAFIASQTTSADTSVEIALGSSAINGTEQTIANETTAPTGVTFSAPADYATGLAIGNMAPDDHKAIWVKRVVDAGAGVANDGFLLGVQGDTAP